MGAPLKTYREKMAQTSKEAIISVVALAIVVIAWIIFGFGLSAFDIRIAETPLWAIMGTIGTWVVAIIICIVLGFGVFKNFSLDDEESEDAAENNSTSPDGGELR